MKKTNIRKEKDFVQSIIESKKDPRFMKDINEFIKITSGVYKIHNDKIEIIA